MFAVETIVFAANKILFAVETIAFVVDKVLLAVETIVSAVETILFAAQNHSCATSIDACNTFRIRSFLMRSVSFDSDITADSAKGTS